MPRRPAGTALARRPRRAIRRSTCRARTTTSTSAPLPPPGHRRLILDELLRVQLGAGAAPAACARPDAVGVRHAVDGERVEAVKRLAAVPTDRRPAAGSCAEIAADLRRPTPCTASCRATSAPARPWWRLTALLAAVPGAASRRRFMAPTEVLAEQHSAGAAARLAGRRCPYSGPVRPAAARAAAHQPAGTGERREALARARAGGTVRPRDRHPRAPPGGRRVRASAWSSIDEQHRFGVLPARGACARQGTEPDVLVMTATPIPRTLALTVYGDLDVSVLDELPPGRQPDHHPLRAERRARERMLESRAERSRRGGQAYVVYPLVEESREARAARAATAGLAQLARRGLPGRGVGLLHGRMNERGEGAVMERLPRRRIHACSSHHGGRGGRGRAERRR